MITAPTAETSTSTKAVQHIDAVLDAPRRRPAAEVVGDRPVVSTCHSSAPAMKGIDPAHDQRERERRCRRGAGTPPAARRCSGTTTCRAGRCGQTAFIARGPFENLVLLDGAVGLVDAHDEREAERERRHADDDGGQDQDVRQRIGIDREGRIEDRRRAADDLSRLDVEQIDRGLEHRQADQLLHHVAAGDDDVEARPPSGRW